MFHRKPKQISPKSHPAQQKLQQTSNTTAPQVKKTHSATLIQRAKVEPSSLSADEVLSLQSAIGNREVSRLLAGRNAAKVQAKLTIGQPGDKYEQEADRVAVELVQQMNAPASPQASQSESAQWQEMEDDELQMKPETSTIQPGNIADYSNNKLMPRKEAAIVQREAIPKEEDELKMKPMVQRQPEGEMAATLDLEASINQARGSGQPFADNIRQPMEQSFGADFSGVKVHTDSQSDQLNQSIQARAFTTGQDIFFRQGEYNPGSRGGQELIAHELTHVVQQNDSAVQRSPQPQEQLPQHSASETPFASEGERAIQAKSELTGNSQESTEESRPNQTGLPDDLKVGVENLSGYSLDDVRVHYNSPKPAQLMSLAYTQGTEIHVAPGQEEHLPHEAWHVVQQMQGRVKPTIQMKGVQINDEDGLEKEADVMGREAFTTGQRSPLTSQLLPQNSSTDTSDLASATGKLRSQVKNPIQLLTPYEASMAVSPELSNWYYTIFVPALMTIAAKSGSSFEDYIQPINQVDFINRVNELKSEFQEEPKRLTDSIRSLFSRTPAELSSAGLSFIDSVVYPGLKRVKDTNILVYPPDNFNQDGTPKAELLKFIRNYQSGTLVWYRGMSISHFSWGVLRRTGVLASEGTRDFPTFTMGNATPTRWLPGVYDREVAKSIAMTVAGDQPGLRQVMENMEIPTGAILRYNVAPPTPVAYLNVGEQVVRGPIASDDIIVDSVVFLGERGFTEGRQNSQPADLPPQAPYRAAENSQAINAWREELNGWLSKRH